MVHFMLQRAPEARLLLSPSHCPPVHSAYEDLLGLYRCHVAANRLRHPSCTDHAVLNNHGLIRTIRGHLLSFSPMSTTHNPLRNADLVCFVKTTMCALHRLDHVVDEPSVSFVDIFYQGGFFFRDFIRYFFISSNAIKILYHLISLPIEI